MHQQICERRYLGFCTPIWTPVQLGYTREQLLSPVTLLCGSERIAHSRRRRGLLRRFRRFDLIELIAGVLAGGVARDPLRRHFPPRGTRIPSTPPLLTFASHSWVHVLFSTDASWYARLQNLEQIVDDSTGRSMISAGLLNDVSLHTHTIRVKQRDYGSPLNARRQHPRIRKTMCRRNGGHTLRPAPPRTDSRKVVFPTRISPGVRG